MPKILTKLTRLLLLFLPAVLFFSYYPIISLGANATMNFELSLPLIWLVLFDFVSFPLVFPRLLSLFSKTKSDSKSNSKSDSKSNSAFNSKLNLKVSSRTLFLLTLPFPLFLSLSLFWSLNPLRGFLTVGILWLIYFAIFAIFSLHHSLSENVVEFTTLRQALLKSFLISSAIISLWCWLQSLLDFLGVARTATLMCAGCTTVTFGFPHPNGFAIEPQFMGNLLIAPTLFATYHYLTSFPKTSAQKNFIAEKLISKNSLFFLLTIFFSATLFLTFSRGAIYSTILALIFLIIFLITKTHSARPLRALVPFCLAFIFTLNAQGLFAEFGPTNETYLSGIAQVIDQLSLGRIKLPFEPEPLVLPAASTSSPIMSSPAELAPAAPTTAPTTAPSANFSGYVSESTNIRLKQNSTARAIWLSSPRHFFFGTGLGSAGLALAEYQNTGYAKEIVQNEYFSLLLETGIFGFLLLMLVFVALFILIKSFKSFPLIFVLILAYTTSFYFFSGLANTIHIFLTPAFLIFIQERRQPLQLHRRRRPKRQ